MDFETIAVLTAGKVIDPYSEELANAWDLQPGQTWETEPSERDVVTLAPAEPRPSNEPTQNARNSVTSGWTLYLPAGDPVSPQDRVRVRGEIYPVQGQPSDWLNAGVVVQAYRTDG